MAPEPYRTLRPGHTLCRLMPRIDLHKRALAVALVALAAGLLALAYCLPTVTYSKLGKADETYSIYGGVEALWEEGDLLLGGIVFGFSVVFPIAKLIALGWVLLGRGQRAWVRVLSLAGKWSMVDVFVITGFIAGVRVGVASGSSRAGIHVFTAGVVVSMLAAMATERWLGKDSPQASAPRLTSGLGGMLLPLAALSIQAAMLVTPFLVVEVKIFIITSTNEMSPLSATRGLWEVKEWALAAVLVAWVWLVPCLRAGLSLLLRMGRGGRRCQRAALRLDEWNMLAVFGLGLVVVWIKLTELTSTSLMVGFWFVLAGSLVGELDAWRLRRDLR